MPLLAFTLNFYLYNLSSEKEHSFRPSKQWFDFHGIICFQLASQTNPFPSQSHFARENDFTLNSARHTEREPLNPFLSKEA
jgi:hypothetical protein